LQVESKLQSTDIYWRAGLLYRFDGSLGSLEIVGSRQSVTSQQIAEERRSLAILKTYLEW
jgi:hypothetical protein